ncbi:MAG: site-specific integrase [Spirochaetia bacterium]|jgi:integrase|nr:site-specific integrase [Spirochaetia bacterium]
MRYREPFTVFPRKMKSGLVVWYYQTYDNNNRRTTARSTGQTSKGAARTYCNKLYKEDALIPNRGENLLFSQYAKDWWVWDKCEYVRFRRSRRELSRNYIDSGRANLRLNIMLNDAIRRGLLDTNPADNVTPLKKNTRERDILTADEVSLIFDYESIAKLWKKKIYYLANLLAAVTGLRVGEILAVRGEVLFEGHILVSKQYNRKYGLIPTKTRDSRQVPVPPELQKELDMLNRENNGGYLFSVTGGVKPINYQSLTRALRQAMVGIGINEDERTKRYICFHSWRHFFNTTMRTNNISDGKLQKLTGHKSQAMTEHYTHFKADDFQDVKKIQAKILQMPRKVG